MEENDAEAVPDVEDEPGEGEQEEGEEVAEVAEVAEDTDQVSVPVRARIICTGGEEPLTIGKALVPGGSPLHMDVPGAGTIVLTATLKPPESESESQPGGDEVKCLCPTGAKRGANAGANDQLQAITSTMEQITSMQQLLSNLKDKAQALSDQLMGGGGGPGPGPMQAMGGAPALPYPGGMPMQQPMAPPGFGGVPPGGREVFSGGGVGIFVVQKGGPPMGGGMPFDYMSPPALPAPDFGQQGWGAPAPMPASQSRGGDAYMQGGGGGGNVCASCGGGGGGMSGCGSCGGGRVMCCGGGVRISCCGGGMPISCCGPPVNPCCGGGGGGGGVPQQQQQGGGYLTAEQLALCQGDCTTPCDSANIPCMGRPR